MRVTTEQFKEEIAKQIRQVSGQEEDPGFVITLRNYVLGLVKHHGTAEPAAMQKKLKEFLEDNTAPFVTWLCKFMRDNEVTTTGPTHTGHTHKPSSVVPRAGAPGAGAGVARERSSEQAERMHSVATAQSSGRSHRSAFTASSRRLHGENEARHRDRHLGSSKAHTHERQRSRSPPQHHTAPPTRRAGHDPPGQVAVFQAALRDAEGAAVAVKQEQFEALPPPPAAAAAAAARHATKAEHLAPDAAAAAPPPPALAPPGWATYLQAAAAQALAPAAQEIDATSVVVMNVHFTATPESLGLFFHQRCGGVMRATILKNAHGMPKGYAYMQLTDPGAAQRAQQLTGTEFMGRTLRVVPKYKRPPPASVPPWMSPLQMLPMMYSQMAPLFNLGMQSGVGTRQAWGRSGRQWGLQQRKGRSDVWLRNERAIEA